jgi:hypothetical protein
MQIVDALRNTLADAIDTDIGATGFVRWYTTGLTTLLASAALSNPAFGAAAAGVITLDVAPAVEDTSPAAAGTAVRLNFYLNNSDASGLWRLQLGIATSGSPDITMANNVIATTDTVQLSSLTITVPAGTPDVT